MSRRATIFPHLPRPLVIAHRGCSHDAPENTMEAFQLCFDHHVPVIELDVHLCADGTLAVIHDASSMRTTGLDLAVEQSGWHELARLDAGSWMDPQFSSSRIPRLEDVLSSFGKHICFDIELKQRHTKDTGLAAAVWNVIQGMGMQDRCYVSSFNPVVLRTIRRLSAGNIETAIIYSRSVELPRILRKGFGRRISGSSLVKPEHSLITQALTAFKRYPLLPWTVDSGKEAEALFQLGVEGIITNRPVEMMRLREAYLR